MVKIDSELISLSWQRVRAPLYKNGRRRRDPRELNSLQLAFIGDGVYTLYVRDLIIRRTNAPVGELNRLCAQRVNAKAQAVAMRGIEALLTAQETEVVRRARNANPNNIARAATRKEYMDATALEALIGFLHVCGLQRRAGYLLDKAVSAIESDAVLGAKPDEGKGK
jgi:ribonuclease-3 family protein